MADYVDPWTTGLKRDYPALYARCEAFLEECAQAAGRKREKEKPAAYKCDHMITEDPRFQAAMERRAKQKIIETDARNRAFVQKVVVGGQDFRAAMKDFDLKVRSSLMGSLKQTYERGGFEDDAYLYFDLLAGKREQVQEEPEEDEEDAFVFDGMNYEEG